MFQFQDWTQPSKKATWPSLVNSPIQFGNMTTASLSSTSPTFKNDEFIFLRCSHLLPKGSFLLQSSPCLLLPLRGKEVPPGVEGLVVEDEEDAANKVAEEGGKDANQEELGVGVEVGD